LGTTPQYKPPSWNISKKCIIVSCMPNKLLLGLFLWLGFALSVFAHSVHTPEGVDETYSNMDMQEGVMLNGGWHFFWKTVYAPSLVPTPNTPEVQVPGEWNEIGYPGKGYGVFKRTVLVRGSKGKRFGLYVPNVCNNYNLYINGQKVASAGVFSTQPATAVPAYEPKVVEFISTSDTIEFAFEVSNFFYREGGINYSIRFGAEETIEKNTGPS
jgi:hypothetical protein